MISLNKFFIIVVMATMSCGIIVRAEDEKSFDVTKKMNELKNVWNAVATQDNIDCLRYGKDVVLDTTEKVFVNNKASMYALATFFLGRASSVAKFAHAENLPQHLSKAARKTVNRNAFTGTGLVILNLYLNRK